MNGKTFDLDDRTPVSAKKVNRLMLDCLELIKDDCPDVAKNALAVAEKFCSGDASTEELEVAREACWNHLKKKKICQDFNKKETCMIRAVICVLFPKFVPRELSDTVDFFEMTMSRLGKGAEVKKLLLDRLSTIMGP